ncbi:MAG: hypothetical protein ACKO55_12735 [Bacteroidota bacterium]
MFKRLTLFFVVLLTYEPLLAQNNKISHSVNITGGTLIFANQGFLHFEKLQERKVVHTFIQGGLGGGYTYFFSSGSSGVFSLVGRTGLLTGKGSSHFEASVGACIIRNSETFLPRPALTMGYRYQHPDAKLIIRSGIGFPEGLYLGFGFRY